MKRDPLNRVLSGFSPIYRQPAVRKVETPSPRGWDKGITSHWGRWEEHSAQWDGKTELVAVQRTKLGRKGAR